MHCRIIGFSLLACVALAASSANAYEFRVRWVERIGPVDVPLFGLVEAYDLQPHRVRLQIGVFDDAHGPAPSGGLFGWSMGTLGADPIPFLGENRRTPGRIGFFMSSDHPNANGNPPLPDGDPFSLLTEIDATRGPETLPWGFDGDGDPLPMPTIPIRGFNSFVSIYEITVRLTPGSSGYEIVAGGDLRAVTAWNILGTPILPDPDTQTPGSVTYAPTPTDPSVFTSRLWVYPGPTPGVASLFVIGGLRSLRRRR